MIQDAPEFSIPSTDLDGLLRCSCKCGMLRGCCHSHQARRHARDMSVRCHQVPSGALPSRPSNYGGWQSSSGMDSRSSVHVDSSAGYILREFLEFARVQEPLISFLQKPGLA